MKIYLDSIGCRLNQGEIDQYARQFRAAGHELVADAAQADLVVVNTCAVTGAAASDSRQKIRQAYRAGVQRIVVTGCWSTLDPAGAAGLDGVQQVVSNLVKDQLVSQVLHLPAEAFDEEPIARKPLPGVHQRTRAFIKVQDGCDNFCTYCVTRLARGAGRSLPVEQVLADIHAALAGGVQEVLLTGVQLGSWGHDFAAPASLYQLVKAILDQTPVTRLRLSSLEPWDLNEEILTLWQDPRMCRHLHLPLQSGSAATLRRMARKITPQAFAHLMDLARQVDAHMAITTDVITGFPGESEEEFTESLAFVEQMNFSGGHVFSFSPRPGTPAARYPNQVPPALRKTRSAAMRAVLARASEAYRARFVQHTLPVLWEGTESFGPQGWRMQGLTDNYLRVRAYAPEHRWNKIDRVLLERLDDEGLEGSIVW